MPRMKPGSARCTHTTAAGKPCQAWAVHGSDPPTCSAHLGLGSGQGAKPGNANALKHGYYSGSKPPAEPATSEQLAGSAALDAEIDGARVAIELVKELLSDPNQSTAEKLAAARVYFVGSSVIANLLRHQRNLSAQPDHSLPASMDYALDQISKDHPIDL